MEKYCAQGGNKDPVCDVSSSGLSILEEIAAVHAHLANSRRAADAAPAETTAAPTEEPEATREEVTAEAVESERATEKSAAVPARPGTWPELSRVIPWETPSAQTAFASADSNDDGAVDAGEFAAEAEAAGFSNGAELFGELGRDELDADAFERAFGDLSTKQVKARMSKDAWDRPADGTMALADFERKARGVNVSRWNAQRVFVSADVNSDGALSAGEYMAAFGSSLSELDALVVGKFGTPEQGFGAADADGDGRVTGAEWAAHCRALPLAALPCEVLLEQIDADADGAITESEYLASVGKRAATVAELKAAMVAQHQGFDGAWEHLSDDSDARMDRGAFLTAVQDLGISNGEALWQLCFGSAQSVGYHEFAEAFGEAVTLPQYRAAVPQPKRAWRQADEDGDGVVGEEEFAAHAAALGYGAGAARDLWHQLGGDSDGLSQAAYVRAMREEAPGGDVRDELATLASRIQAMEDHMAALEAAGKLDVALKQELEQQLAAMKKFQKVAQGMADGREPGEEELAELNSVMRDVDSTTTGVANLIPHGNQWWRYGYEYLFVQAWLLALLFAVALAVGWPLGRLRASIPAPTRPGLLAHWFNEASYTMAVVAIASAFLQSVVHALPEGLLVRALPAILKLLGARDSNGGELLTPQTTLQIEEMLLAIVTELVAVVIVYYFISYVLVHESEKKKSHWAKLDGELPKWTKARYEERLAARKGGTPRDTHLTQRLGRQLTRRPSLFDRNVEQFECIRDYFVAHLIDPEAPLRKAVARAGGEKALREEKLKQFRLSWYFRMNINECVVILLTISWPTWVFLMVWYLLLGYLAAAWHATYLKCMVIVGLSSVLVLGALVVFSYQRYHMLAQLSDGQGSLAREDIPDQPLHAGVMLWAMRSMTLVLIYGSVQFIGSDFCWKYYPVPIAVFVVVLGAFLVVWCRSWINIVPVYAAAMALPPFHNEGMADHHAEQILASCLDDNEWLEANEKAEKGTEAASLSRDGRVNVADVVAGSGASRIRTAARVAQAAQAFRSRASPAHVAEPAVQAFRSRASPAHVAEPSFPDRAER